jgi:hypothetical protein
VGLNASADPYAGKALPAAVRRLLEQACWNADAVQDDLRAYVVEHPNLASCGGSTD